MLLGLAAVALAAIGAAAVRHAAGLTLQPGFRRIWAFRGRALLELPGSCDGVHRGWRYGNGA